MYLFSVLSDPYTQVEVYRHQEEIIFPALIFRMLTMSVCGNFILDLIPTITNIIKIVFIVCTFRSLYSSEGL